MEKIWRKCWKVKVILDEGRAGGRCYRRNKSKTL